MSDEATISQEARSASRVKKKRLRGACDACRIRKSDSAESPLNICSSCIANNVRCRHEMPRYQKLIDRHEEAIDYINNLQDRIQKLENYIQKIHPGQDIDRIINEPDGLLPANASYASTSSGTYGSISLKYPSNVDPHTNTVTYSTPENNDDQLGQDELDEISLSKDLKNLSTSDPADVRFFGQASSVMLAKHVTDVKKEITGDSEIVLSSKYRRPIYWNLCSWELPYINDLETVYIYPEYDLLMELITIYFEKVNNLIPLLHQPTFMESVKSGQHHWDSSFGMVVLLVCAHGAKYSKDPRVFMPDDSIGLSSGWKYFIQVPLHRKQLLYKSTVYDLQYYAARPYQLASMFLVGTSMPYACWNFAVIGLRYAYEKGIHRRQGQGNAPTVESELLKRAFWVLVCIDCCSSSFVGRPCTMHEAHDVEYPIECDDEYWETGDPKTAFKQPQGKPCSITAFNCFIKLCEILGFALRTLYANKKSKALLGFIGPDWEGKMVAELDSSINKWSEDLPEHLQWDPHRKDTVVFNQTSIAYTAGMVITFSLLAASRSTGQTGGSKEDIENLQKCMNYLQQIENRDSLREAGDIPEHGSQHINNASSSNDPSTVQSDPTHISQDMTEMSTAMFNELLGSTNISGSNHALNSWDLQRILLVEMGYLPNESAPITTSITSSLGPENPQLQNSAGIFQSNDGFNAFTQTVNGALSPLSDATNLIK
ncbi:Transcriptional activator protein acu-15 [Psilocybe cubensis]|uniref:Transcriptional activator protein acu-15 n=1 Tax=Psilocybe cubensis TaxID=181762 RepID=A0ACB8GTK0_PSICU|nr:Transcriptional activator protein acu-15 [Psilocybe cubensis]KAH9478784.1 Transcriptional activator protein acu-15 [Psilocybe cubensis]